MWNLSRRLKNRVPELFRSTFCWVSAWLYDRIIGDAKIWQIAIYAFVGSFLRFFLKDAFLETFPMAERHKQL
ncbi:hypothetical protein B932_2517 [Gluconobacter oxydans H24]|nr:hypothetical protein B932_2517 [Gluconobacter oxydans H24]